jgi:hypothetical protein
MEMKFDFLKRTFADVYGNSYNPTNFTGPVYTQTLNTNDNNVYVHDCVFSYCSSSSNGGALICGSNVYRLLVEQTAFISCSTLSGAGGGIYFSNSASGECVLSRICGYNCSSTGSGPFAYIYLKNDVNNKNYVNDSSFTRSLKKSGSPARALYIFNGNILCQSVNISNNECDSYSGIYCRPTASSVSDTCCISHSSIVNNTANGRHGCIILGDSGTSMTIDTCNILNNIQTDYSSNEISFYVHTYLLIKDSCVLGNNQGKRVFHVTTSGKVTLSNCTIDDDIFSKTRYSGSVTITKMIERTFINALLHISTQKCDSYFDSYGTLTAKPNVPTQRTKHPCFGYFMSYVCKKPTIDPLMIMKCIFLLTMLPSDPSSGYYFNSNCYLHLAFVNK